MENDKYLIWHNFNCFDEMFELLSEELKLNFKEITNIKLFVECFHFVFHKGVSLFTEVSDNPKYNIQVLLLNSEEIEICLKFKVPSKEEDKLDFECESTHNIKYIVNSIQFYRDICIDFFRTIVNLYLND